MVSAELESHIVQASSPAGITVSFEDWLAEDDHLSAEGACALRLKMTLPKTLETSKFADMSRRQSPPASPPRDSPVDVTAGAGALGGFIDNVTEDDLVDGLLSELSSKDIAAAIGGDVPIAFKTTGGIKRSAMSPPELDIARRGARARRADSPPEKRVKCAGDMERRVFPCTFPGCVKEYASTDAVRKHCRLHHPGWLRGGRQQ